MLIPGPKGRAREASALHLARLTPLDDGAPGFEYVLSELRVLDEPRQLEVNDASKRTVWDAAGVKVLDRCRKRLKFCGNPDARVEGPSLRTGGASRSEPEHA